MDRHRSGEQQALPIGRGTDEVSEVVLDGSSRRASAEGPDSGRSAERAPLGAAPAESVAHGGRSSRRAQGPKDGPSPGALEARGAFRGPQVCKIIGITYRQLDYWARTDLLRPSVHDARGSGSQRLYSYTDLVQLKVIKRLIAAGVSPRATRKAIECLRNSGADLASAKLVIVDDKTVLAGSGEEVFDLMHGGQGVLTMALGVDKLASEVDAAITELRRNPRPEEGRHASQTAPMGATGPLSGQAEVALG